MSIDKEYYFLHFSNSLVTDRIVDTRATQNIFLEQKMPTHPLPPPPFHECTQHYVYFFTFPHKIQTIHLTLT